MNKILRAFVFVTLLFCSISSAASSQAIFQLDQNNEDKTFTATITIKNNSTKPIKHWQLAFNSIATLKSVDEGVITKNIGYYYLISPDTSVRVIPAHGEIVFHLVGKRSIKHVTDAPNGFFIIATQPVTHKQTILSLERKIILPEWKPTDEQAAKSIQNQTSIEGNAVMPQISVEESLIVPLPAELTRQSGKFVLDARTQIFIDERFVKNIGSAATFLAESLAPVTGYKGIRTPLIHSPASNGIWFTGKGTDSSLGNEGYILEVSEKNIIVRANAAAGFFYAAQSLRQLLPPAVFDKRLVKNVEWDVPCVVIRDYPRFGYRGILLDVARHFFPKNQVKRLIDLMALHKLNRLQWHLTDDEGWRIEIKRYPELVSVGAWRGFNRPLPPVLGSGAKAYGGYYSQNDIREIVQYAKERHITIIPEIDMPGHARAMLMSLPQLLIDERNTSSYVSAQRYKDNVLSPCRESTFVVINNIMSEVAKLFPGETIHIGSDEVPQEAWTKSPHCQQFMAAHGMQTQDQLQNYFLKRVEKIIASKGKKIAVWDDAIKSNGLETSTRVYSWTSEKAGFDAAQNGYPVVLMPASYLYFDLAYSDNPQEPGFYWAGLVDTFRVYSYQPIDPKWPLEVTSHILGVEGALWSENIDSQQKLDYFAFPKILALSELAWTPKERRNWINFSERLDKLHLKRLDHYKVNYRSNSVKSNFP